MNGKNRAAKQNALERIKEFEDLECIDSLYI